MRKISLASSNGTRTLNIEGCMRALLGSRVIQAEKCEAERGELWQVSVRRYQSEIATDIPDGPATDQRVLSLVADRPTVPNRKESDGLYGQPMGRFRQIKSRIPARNWTVPAMDWPPRLTHWLIRAQLPVFR